MAVDYFLKLDTIQGESQADKHADEIQVLSWSWGASNVSSVHATSGSGAGKADVADLNMMINLDKSYPKLVQALTRGTHLKTGLLAAVKAGAANANYFTMEMQEVFVSSLQISASSEIPTVSLSLTFKSFKLDYYAQDAEGTVKNAGTAGWDVVTNKTT